MGRRITIRPPRARWWRPRLGAAKPPSPQDSIEAVAGVAGEAARAQIGTWKPRKSPTIKATYTAAISEREFRLHAARHWLMAPTRASTWRGAADTCSAASQAGSEPALFALGGFDAVGRGNSTARQSGQSGGRPLAKGRVMASLRQTMWKRCKHGVMMEET